VGVVADNEDEMSKCDCGYRVDDYERIWVVHCNLHAAAPELLESLKEINQHLRDVVETQKNGDRNNWEGYYVPEFAKLSQKFGELIRKTEDAQ
jgi:acetone carboxylase gamma subunit